MSLKTKLEALETQEIRRALRVHKGNMTKTAITLQIPLRTLYSRCDALGISPNLFR